MSRLDGAIQAIREAISAATGNGIPAAGIGYDQDIIEEFDLDNLELISLSLILEELFGISIPQAHFESALYRTPASLAEWCIRKSDEAAWRESQRQRHRA